ncbi:MAG: hypothetical protein JXP34_09475 [Planctomycetes bacterium]|nr:hypothetical protein [Planctomycetota bacterium]
MMTRLSKIAWLCLLAPAMAAEPAERPAWDLGAVRSDANRVWTLAVYLAADNDLESEALDDLNEMEEVLPEQGLEIIVLLDRAKEHDAADGDWTDARVFRVRRGDDPWTIESEILSKPGELDLGDPKTLEGFLACAFRTFPAKRHALAIGGYGRGWQGHAADIDAPGARDGFDELTLGELRAAIDGGAGAAGIPKLDLVVLDMSLMAQIEVAAEIQPLADALVASEALLPPGGLPYAAVLPALAKDAPGGAAAAAIVEACGRSFDEAGERFSMLSAVDLAKLPDLISAFDALVRKLEDAAPAIWPLLCRAIFYAESYGERDDLDPNHDKTSSADLIDMVRRMALNADAFPAEEEALAVDEAADGCLLARHRGWIRAASADIAIHAPLRKKMLLPAYERTAFARTTRWLPFLRNLHELQARGAGTPAIRDLRIIDEAKGSPDTVAAGGAGRVGFTLEGAGILRASVRDLARIPGGGGFSVISTSALRDPGFAGRKERTEEALGRTLVPVFPDGKSRIERPVDWIALGVTDGRRILDATFDASDPSDLVIARVPAIYAHVETGAVVADIIFTGLARATAVVANISLAEGILVRRRIAPRPDASISPIREIISGDAGWKLKRTGTLRWGDGLEIAPQMQEGIAHAFLIEVETIAGETAREVFPYRLEERTGLGVVELESAVFDAEALVGSWGIETGSIGAEAEDLVFRAGGGTLTFARDPGAKNRLLYTWERPGTDRPERGYVRVVGESIPSLLFFRRVRDVEPVRSGMYFGFRMHEEGRTTFILKDTSACGALRLVPASPRDA